jgi:hypothetical protein
VAFSSVATNLIQGGTNGMTHVFVRDCTPVSFSEFCFGDGSTAACPCGHNSVQFGHAVLAGGCANFAYYIDPQNMHGAQLVGMGASQPDTIHLTASSMLSTALNIYLQGDALAGNGVTFGDGIRCVSGQLLRIGVKTAVHGQSQYPGVGDLSVSAKSSALGAPIPVGAIRYYQTYYRDANLSFCPVGFNVTSAVRVVW